MSEPRRREWRFGGSEPPRRLTREDIMPAPSAAIDYNDHLKAIQSRLVRILLKRETTGRVSPADARFLDAIREHYDLLAILAEFDI